MDTTEKFTGKAEIYSKYRPGYPKKYIDYLISYNNLTSEKTVADIGSGTGIFTRELLQKNLKVIAVEPNEDMRNIAVESLKNYPKYTQLSTTAENTGIADNSIDLVTATQAFHWFDMPKFKVECKRILKPDCNVALVWNSRDFTSPLVNENAEICKKFCPDFKGFSGGMEENHEIYGQFFKDGKYETKFFTNDMELDLDSFIGRNLSASYALTKADANYDEFIEAIINLFEKYKKGGKIEFRNITRSYIGKV